MFLCVTFYAVAVSALQGYNPAIELNKCPQLVIKEDEYGHLVKVDFIALQEPYWLNWDEFGFFSLGPIANFTDTSAFNNRTLSELATYYDFQSGAMFYEVAQGETEPTEEDIERLFKFFLIEDKPTSLERETEDPKPVETEVLSSLL